MTEESRPQDVGVHQLQPGEAAKRLPRPTPRGPQQAEAPAGPPGPPSYPVSLAEDKPGTAPKGDQELAASAADRKLPIAGPDSGKVPPSPGPAPPPPDLSDVQPKTGKDVKVSTVTVKEVKPTSSKAAEKDVAKPSGKDTHQESKTASKGKEETQSKGGSKEEAQGKGGSKDKQGKQQGSAAGDIASGIMGAVGSVGANTKGGVDAALDTAAKLKTAKDYAEDKAQQASNLAGKGVETAQGTYESAKDIAGKGAEVAQGAYDQAKDLAESGWEAAQEATGATEETLERAGSWVGWGQQQVSQASSATYNNVVYPLASLWWYLFVTLPYQVVSTGSSVAWRSTAWLWSSGADAGAWLAANATAIINKFADVAFHMMLGALRTVNQQMDKLITNTPRLLHKTLAAARDAKAQRAAAEPRGEARPSGEAAESRTQGAEAEPSPETVDELELSQETDIARAANEALHRVFDKQHTAEGESEADADAGRSTMLVEARKLAWHAWMLVALQVTAIRTVLRVTEGMLSWVLSAWLQLITAAIILSAMAAAAPAAATAAAFAWASHFLLKQVLSLKSYRHTAQSLVGPPLHSAMIALDHFLAPYLEVEEEEVEQVHEEEHKEAGEVKATREVHVEGAEETTEHIDEHGPTTVAGVKLPSNMNEAKQLLASWLQTGVEFTEHLLPEQYDDEGEEAEATAEREVAPETAEQEEAATAKFNHLGISLEEARDEAEQAYSKASSLAAAAAYTVADTTRVILIGLSTRFNFPLPSWVPGLDHHAVSPALAAEPAMNTFNRTAGEGPASGAQAVGTAVSSRTRSSSRGRPTQRA